MRTTLTLDDDVASALRERARRLNLPFKQVVNEALRRGLSPAADKDRQPEYRIMPNQSELAPGIDPVRFNQINDQLESGAFSHPDTA